MLTCEDLDHYGGCGPNPKVAAAPLPELLRAVAGYIVDDEASRRLEELAASIENPDPHAAEQAVAVAEEAAGPNGTPTLSLAEEAAILRRLHGAHCTLIDALPAMPGKTTRYALQDMRDDLDRLQASNTAHQASTQEPRVEPGDLPETGIDKYKRVEEGEE